MDRFPVFSVLSSSTCHRRPSTRNCTQSVRRVLCLTVCCLTETTARWQPSTTDMSVCMFSHFCGALACCCQAMLVLSWKSSFEITTESRWICLRLLLVLRCSTTWSTTTVGINQYISAWFKFPGFVFSALTVTIDSARKGR